MRSRLCPGTGRAGVTVRRVESLFVRSGGEIASIRLSSNGMDGAAGRGFAIGLSVSVRLSCVAQVCGMRPWEPVGMGHSPQGIRATDGDGVHAGEPESAGRQGPPADPWVAACVRR